MRFRSTIVVGIPLLLVLQGSSAAEQRPTYGNYARPQLSAPRNPALPLLPWEKSPAIPRVATGPTTPEDVNWGTEFGLPIPNGAVTCIAIFDGALIVGGEFTHIGGKKVGYVARWDGAEWMSLGSGLDAPAAALLANGSDLLVGGSFRAAGGVSVQGLARWDGSTWSAIGGDITGVGGAFVAIRALAVYHDELVAGGDFLSSERPEIRGIARFDGTTWNPLGSGIQAGGVTAVTVFRDSLYVAGNFNTAGSITALQIARWNGSDWAALGGGLTSGSPKAMAVFNDRLYVGGDFREAGGLETPALAMWDGVEWTPMNNPYFLRFWDVNSLAAHQGKLYVGAGSYGFDTWDGNSWDGSIFLAGWCFAFGSDGPDLLVGGSFTSFPEPGATNIGRWDGTLMHGFETWGSKSNGLAAGLFGPEHEAYVASMAFYRGELLVTGFVSRYGSVSGWGPDLTQAIPAWSGSSWRTFDSIYPPFGPLPSSYYLVPTPLHSSGDFLYLGGQFPDQEGPHAVLRFDGASWSALDTLSGQAIAITTVNGIHYVVINRNPALCFDNAAPVGSIYQWTEGHWVEIASVTAGAEQYWWCLPAITGLSEYHDELIAQGTFDEIGGTPAKGIARWSGGKWRTLGERGPRGCVFPLTSGVTVGDRFVVPTHECPDLAFQSCSLEYWDGESWGSIPSLRGYVACLAGIEGVLYAGGRFQLDGAGPEETAATWDGLEWSLLGSGFDTYPSVIVEHDGAIYFGGEFSTAGGKSSFGIARWNGHRRAPTLRAPSLSSARPNPFRVSADLSLQLDGEGSVRVAVYDVSGRELAVLEDGFRSAGPHSVRWDGRDRLGKQVPAGVYFISARSANGAVSSRKVVRLR